MRVGIVSLSAAVALARHALIQVAQSSAPNDVAAQRMRPAHFEEILAP